jgi:hypothetical protein
VIGFFMMMTVPPVHALEIRIDFSDGSGAPAGNWNTIDQVNMTDTDLIDFVNGLVTGVDVTTAGFFGEVNNGLAWTGTKDWVDGDPVGDDLFTSTSPASVILSRLGAGPLQVEVLVAASFGGFTQDTQVGGMFGDRTFESNPQDGNDFDASVNGTVPLDWVIWDNVTPSAGNISISLSTSTNLFINAVRVSTVPEPSTGTLLMLGLIVLGRQRSRSARRGAPQES